MQELEFMDLGRVRALREVDNLLNFARFNKLLLYHLLTHEFTLTLI